MYRYRRIRKCKVANAGIPGIELRASRNPRDRHNVVRKNKVANAGKPGIGLRARERQYIIQIQYRIINNTVLLYIIHRACVLYYIAGIICIQYCTVSAYVKCIIHYIRVHVALHMYAAPGVHTRGDGPIAHWNLNRRHQPGQ